MDQMPAPPEDPRAGRSERRPVRLDGFVALPDGSTCEIAVVDMSYEGCRIATSATLSEGETVVISVLRLGAIEGTVRWVRDGEAGLVFTPVVEEAPQQATRRSTRLDMSFEVTLRRSGQHNFKVRAFDLSSDGCKVEFIDRPDEGETVWIKFDGLDALQAKVRWIERSCLGLEFERPIHPAVFELLIARLG
jgi:hypothetical protein